MVICFWVTQFYLFYNDVKSIDFEDIQDEVYSLLLSKIAKEKMLVKRGNILINLDVITYAPIFFLQQ